MKVLLDTHGFIWWDSQPEQLSKWDVRMAAGFFRGKNLHRGMSQETYSVPQSLIIIIQ